MRVGQTGSNQVHGNEAANAKRTGKTGAADAPKRGERAASGESAAVVADGASADISSKGKEFARAKSIANDVPDMREEKIAELKKRIAAGSYKVDSDAVADKMVNDHLSAGIG